MASYPQDLRQAHSKPITLSLALLLLSFFFVVGLIAVVVGRPIPPLRHGASSSVTIADFGRF